MSFKVTALAWVFGLNAYALGPIPNGTYTGTLTCGTQSFPSTLTFTDDEIFEGPQENQLTTGKNGFFTINSVKGMKETGLGHFTKDGLHFEAIVDFDNGDGKPQPSHGWDTYTYKDEKLYEDAAAEGPKGTVPCTGVWSKAVAVPALAYTVIHCNTLCTDRDGCACHCNGKEYWLEHGFRCE